MTDKQPQEQPEEKSTLEKIGSAVTESLSKIKQTVMGEKKEDPPQQRPDSEDLSSAHGAKDQFVGGTKQYAGQAMGREDLEDTGYLQKEGGKAEFNRPSTQGRYDSGEQSTISGVKDQVVGGTKQYAGQAMGREDLEDSGYIQKEGGKAEFNRPSQTQGTQQGPYSGEQSTISGVKDQVVGGTKQYAGQALGREDLEDSGYIQKEGGKAEFNRPSGPQGTQERSYSGEKSTITGIKDEVVGVTKQATGKVLGKEGLEDAGYVQKECGKAEINRPSNPSHTRESGLERPT